MDEAEWEVKLLSDDCKMRGWFVISFHLQEDKHTCEVLNDGKPHYAIAYLDNKQTRFHYYTFVEAVMVIVNSSLPKKHNAFSLNFQASLIYSWHSLRHIWVVQNAYICSSHYLGFCWLCSLPTWRHVSVCKLIIYMYSASQANLFIHIEFYID